MTRRRYSCRCIIRSLPFVFASLLVVILMMKWYKVSTIGIPNTHELKNNGTWIILYWNSPEDWFDSYENCEYKNCIFTKNHANFKNSHAVLFHANYDTKIELGKVPNKIPGQIWIYLSLEPPGNRPSFGKFKRLINWTVSYRRDADLTVPYHKVVKNKIPANLNTVNSFAKKSKFAAWFVSNCNTFSKRENFVDVLQKYVEVDIFGKCGKLECKRIGTNHTSCLRMLNRDYKFYLSLENSLCQDYITEKPFHVMNESIVPILWKSYNASLFLPPNSYIDENDFHTIRDLALYLKSLSNNYKRYKKYFTWKKYYKVTGRCRDTLCSICKRLNQQENYKRLYDDVEEWVNGKNSKKICKEAIIPKI